MTKVPLSKSYPTFDCDAHIMEAPPIWDYLSTTEKELVRPWYWPEGDQLIVNRDELGVGHWALNRFTVSPVQASGPGVTKPILRKLLQMRLSPEQLDYVNHKGAVDPHARIADMDLQGIDQVVVIPLAMFSAFLFVRDFDAAELMCRAYNDWVYDWCSAYPGRLFPAAALPVQHPGRAANELLRVADKGFKVAMVRPVDIRGRYPNQMGFAPVWRAFEETGIAVGMHNLLSVNSNLAVDDKQWTPGQFLDRAINQRQIAGGNQTLSFVHEAHAWLTSTLLCGFFETYPGVRAMAIMESNAGWLPNLLEELDRAVKLYRRERNYPCAMLPSERFKERCFIAFEGDEAPVYDQPEFYENIGVWSSDVYHHDGADAWTAIRYMDKAGLAPDVRAKIMGANASRMYGIEPKLYVKDAPGSIPRPEWYPSEEDVLAELADRL